jgi:hypothetical protein
LIIHSDMNIEYIIIIDLIHNVSILYN